MALSSENPNAVINDTQFGLILNATMPWPKKVPNMPIRKTHSNIFFVSKVYCIGTI